MEHLADCPICQKLVADEVETKSTHCSLILLGKTRVAVLNSHQPSAEPEALADAFKLLNFTSQAGSYVGEYTESPGHWAVCLVKLTGLPFGTSEVKT